MNYKGEWSVAVDTTGKVPGLRNPPYPGEPYYAKKVLTDEQCAETYYAVLNIYRKKLLSKVYTRTGEGNQLDLSARHTHYYNPDDVKGFSEIADSFNRSVGEAVNSLWPGLSASPASSYQVLGYEERCLFRSHCDNSLFVQGSWVRNDKERDLTGILYLTDQADHAVEPLQFSGGSLVLDNIKDSSDKPLELRPQKGWVTVFPAHPVFRHQVLPVTAGYRIAIVNWWKVR